MEVVNVCRPSKIARHLRTHCGTVGGITVIPGERKERKRLKKALQAAAERRATA